MASNIFDSMKGSLFDLTTATFGYSGVWTDQADVVQTARIHFRHPNENESLTMGIVFCPTDYFMEYKSGDLPGLYDLVRGGSVETVYIETHPYLVMSIRSVYDGDTYQAHLQKQ